MDVSSEAAGKSTWRQARPQVDCISAPDAMAECPQWCKRFQCRIPACSEMSGCYPSNTLSMTLTRMLKQAIVCVGIVWLANSNAALWEKMHTCSYSSIAIKKYIAPVPSMQQTQTLLDDVLPYKGRGVRLGLWCAVQQLVSCLGLLERMRAPCTPLTCSASARRCGR